METFKMKDVEYKKELVWHPNCMTRSWMWFAFLNGEPLWHISWDVGAETKAEAIEEVRRIRREMKKKGV